MGTMKVLQQDTNGAQNASRAKSRFEGAFAFVPLLFFGGLQNQLPGFTAKSTDIPGYSVLFR